MKPIAHRITEFENISKSKSERVLNANSRPKVCKVVQHGPEPRVTNSSCNSSIASSGTGSSQNNNYELLFSASSNGPQTVTKQQDLDDAFKAFGERKLRSQSNLNQFRQSKQSAFVSVGLGDSNGIARLGQRSSGLHYFFCFYLK